MPWQPACKKVQRSKRQCFKSWSLSTFELSQVMVKFRPSNSRQYELSSLATCTRIEHISYRSKLRSLWRLRWLQGKKTAALNRIMLQFKMEVFFLYEYSSFSFKCHFSSSTTDLILKWHSSIDFVWGGYCVWSLGASILFFSFSGQSFAQQKQLSNKHLVTIVIHISTKHVEQ